ncbi:MAG TPA: metal-dependent hydrolase [Ktedonobacteraceae bacterium]|jgi:inner membrane protein|nr:metal-dependent hydrolase [Ktedonobacteraceae bacterium]
MVGKSHLMVGLTAGVVLDSFAQVTGPHLVGASHISLALIIDKAIFYVAVGFGSLLPDIDNAHSTLGKKLGWISKEIQHKVGHRTLFHSFLGLICGAFIAFGLQELIQYLLLTRGYTLPAHIISDSHIIFIAVLFGSIMHIAADALTEEGVPLFWPVPVYYGFPPSRKWRFRTGTWPEHVIVYGFILLVAIGMYYSFITI